jgi:hypothetical protein
MLLLLFNLVVLLAWLMLRPRGVSMVFMGKCGATELVYLALVDDVGEEEAVRRINQRAVVE